VAPRYFRLGRAAGGGYSAQELPPPDSFRSAAFLNVQAIAESRDGDSPLQTVDYLRHKQQLETLINRTLETAAG
jgi:hypothetical protein